MSLKPRNITAWVLILISAISWSAAQFFSVLEDQGDFFTEATSQSQQYVTGAYIDTSEVEETVFPPPESQKSAPDTSSAPMFPNLSKKAMRAGRILLFAAGAAAAVVSVFVLYQKKPLMGGDGAMLLLALAGMERKFGIDPFRYASAEASFIYALSLVLILSEIRELWGWVRAQFPSGWHLLTRMTKRLSRPQTALLFMGGWMGTLMICASLVLFARCWLSALSILGAAAMAGACLWEYGAGLQHFKEQLDRFQRGQPIDVKEGTMEAAEKQLSQVQLQHQEAVKAAVASERFKVDLISNVSHDLRTPLTAIVGYGELLEQETLSEEGAVQLSRLNQKAGYMRELVDSLFELTKVSSGVLESKKEEIDLIRLLEQTIGLMDDQLSMAGLTIKRQYAAQSIPMITDGSRMHQVFANLLGNAIKYALAGTRIYLQVQDAGDCYRVRMVNTSSYEMDFDPNEIMQRFARGDKARSTKGSGLGLAIAQTYTESVGGQFHVTVDADQFSAIVSLPKTERNL